MIQKYSQLLHDPEILIRTAKGLMSVRVKTEVDQ